MEVAFSDVSPNSVLALWVLPKMDPGAPITEVRIQYRIVDAEETWEQAGEVVVDDISSRSRRISGLIPGTQYQLQVALGNWIGHGEAVSSPIFSTPPPGFPGSVSQLAAKNILTNQLALCWLASSTGAHSEYFIEAISLNITVEDQAWTYRVGDSRLVGFPNGTEAAVVGGQVFTALPWGCGRWPCVYYTAQGLRLVALKCVAKFISLMPAKNSIYVGLGTFSMSD